MDAERRRRRRRARPRARALRAPASIVVADVDRPASTPAARARSSTSARRRRGARACRSRASAAGFEPREERRRRLDARRRREAAVLDVLPVEVDRLPERREDLRRRLRQVGRRARPRPPAARRRGRRAPGRARPRLRVVLRELPRLGSRHVTVERRTSTQIRSTAPVMSKRVEVARHVVAHAAITAVELGAVAGPPGSAPSR